MSKKTKGYSARKQSHTRRRLWERNPHCYWCGKLTRYDPTISTGVLEHNDATVDHYESRYRRKGRPTTVVLACFECNQKRNIDEIASIPLEEKWRLGKAVPKRFSSQDTI